jgi:hypothetical protein
LAKTWAKVGLHRAARHVQALTDLGVGEPFGDQGHDMRSVGVRLSQPSWGRWRAPGGRLGGAASDQMGRFTAAWNLNTMAGA